MCGIAGIYSIQDNNVSRLNIQNMLDTMPYRGPDDSGIYLDGNVGLGHLRLSILDLSNAGHQPMPSQDNRYVMSYNGEVYNYKELALELNSFGWVFHTGSDTEVILAAYQQWGEKCLDKFNGMWAMAIWDTLEKTLFCARDRFGVKPFYYHFNNDQFTFASEIKALIQNKNIDATMDEQTVGRFIRYQKKPEFEATSFKGIKQIKPGGYCYVTKKGIEHHTYWQLPDKSSTEKIKSEKELIATLEELFCDSVDLRLRSDVPVGACLSGGIDSSAIVGEINRKKRDIKTFTVGYKGVEHDETEYARDVIKRNEFVDSSISFPNGEDLFEVLKTTTWHYDEPTWNAAAYSWWHVMKLAQSQDVTVILNGQGADELFAGYPTYYLSYMRQLLTSGKFGYFYDELKAMQKRYDISAFDIVKLLVGPMLTTTKRSLQKQRGNSIASYLCQDFSGSFLDHERAIEANGYSNLSTHLKNDIEISRLPMLLQAEDRFSMAFSLESRVPWLDYRIAEFARRLPDNNLLYMGSTKQLIKQSLSQHIPQSILNRQDKKGYSTPGDDWLKKDKSGVIRDYLNSGIIDQQNIFNKHKLRQMVSKTGLNNVPKNFWQILSTLVWHETFLLK